MQPPKTTIIADDREQNSEVVAVLNEMAGVNLIIHRLKIGDYMVNGSCLFERKTLLDFAASIKDGRLFQQTRKLANSRLNSALILEGTSDDLKGSKMSRAAMQGAIITVSIIYGLPILKAMNGDESASLMIYTAQQQQRFSQDAISRPKKRPKEKRKAQLYLLQSIPEIGPKRAKSLIENFGSIEEIFKKDLDELTSVPGIGKKAAKAIRWVVG